jgi:protease IV
MFKKFLKFVLLSILSLLVILFLFGLFAALTMGPHVKDNSLLVLNLDGPVLEQGPQNWKERFLLGDVLTTRGILNGLEKAKTDKRIKALLVTAGGAETGLAKAQEIRSAIKDFAKVKPTYGSIEMANTLDYYLCAAAPKVFMSPDGEGGIELIGLRAELPFFKGTFDKLGIEAQMDHVGQFKSYSEMYTRDKMSDPAREEITSLLDSIYNQITSDIAADRKVPVERIRQIIDAGPGLRAENKRDGLVTDLLYRDQVMSLIKKETRTGDLNQIDMMEYQKPGFSESVGAGKSKIAIVYATGAIVSGESSRQPGEDAMGSTTIGQALRAAREDSTVKAVVLRVDSPGGSALASDVIWREVAITKQQKPVVVSMANVAASGGYYISMGASKVLADPASITGSIGVVFGKFYVKGLYDKLGFTKDIVKRGNHADMYSEYVPFSASDWEIIHKQMNSIYDTFTRKAAEGRNRTQAQIQEVAQGRVWSGEQAIGLGLINQIGGFKEAIREARKLAKIPDKEEVGFLEYPVHRGGFSDILYAQAPVVQLPAELTRMLALARLAEREPFLLLMPYRIQWN